MALSGIEMAKRSSTSKERLILSRESIWRSTKVLDEVMMLGSSLFCAAMRPMMVVVMFSAVAGVRSLMMGVYGGQSGWGKFPPP